MVINNNLSALKTYNNLSKASKGKGKVMEKISSGLRINRASDDAAGASITQKMKAQIRGLDQASRNIQDGISLIQTAESALGEIENPNLQRMRELCIYAANGNLNKDDRGKIQAEINEIRSGINEIANNTEFNTMKVLRPEIMEDPPRSIYGKADIVFIVDISGSMAGTIDNVISNLDIFTDVLFNKGVDFNLGLISYSDVLENEPIAKWTFTNNIDDFKNNMTAMRANMLGGGDTNESGLEGIMDADNGAVSLLMRTDSSKQFILITDAPVHDKSSEGDNLSSYNINDVALELKNKNIKLTVVAPIGGEVSKQLKTLSETTGGNYFNIYGDFSSQLESLAEDISDDAGSVKDEEKMRTIILQIGPNSSEQFSIELFDARTSKLGIDEIAVDPHEEAEKSISKLDEAIKKVSSQRGKFGAYQNALEYIANNASNYSINLTSAESRIEDSDIAKEIMEMTKNNILEEASQTLLKQAQEMPESILNLMKTWQNNK